MTHQEFERFSSVEQIDLLWKCGVHLADRTEGKFLIKLYQIEGFYAEVFYTKNGNRVITLRGFADIIFLDPYLTAIDLKDLIC